MMKSGMFTSRGFRPYGKELSFFARSFTSVFLLLLFRADLETIVSRLRKELNYIVVSVVWVYYYPIVPLCIVSGQVNRILCYMEVYVCI